MTIINDNVMTGYLSNKLSVISNSMDFCAALFNEWYTVKFPLYLPGGILLKLLFLPIHFW